MNHIDQNIDIRFSSLTEGTITIFGTTTIITTLWGC